MAKNRFKAFTEQERNVLDELLCRLDEEMFFEDDFYDGDQVAAMIKIAKKLSKEVQKSMYLKA